MKPTYSMAILQLVREVCSAQGRDCQVRYCETLSIHLASTLPVGSGDLPC